MALLQEIKVPLLAVNDTSLTVVEIAFPGGHRVKTGDPVLVFETSKTTYDALAETDGYIQYLCETGKDYEVNYIAARIFSEPDEAGQTTVPGLLPIVEAGEPAARANRADWTGETLFSLEAGLLIDSSGIGRSIFKGKDFVTRRDVEMATGSYHPVPSRHTDSPRSAPTAPIRPARQASTLPDPAKTIVERLSRNKKKEIEYLGEVQSGGLTSTINVTVETEDIFVHINQSLKYLKDSLLPVILYETGRLLRKYRVLNSYFSGDAIAFYKEVNIGFAIDLEDKGLKVLKIAHTDSKTIAAIEEEILSLSNRYLDELLGIGDLSDISFTVTDLSSQGVSFFRPLVNTMNSAILGVSSIDEKLQRMILSLTFDHRVTEGKTVAAFLSDLKGRLESYRPDGTTVPVEDVSCFRCLKTLQEDLAGTGFVKCITPHGKDGYICQACLKGF
ncbi:MAG: 2-oxo acid dehydrogenase subunit E2 [Puia sp.]|nr:2-oxo acid dehydrogenase subunit E2 [Puia sp.]